MLVSEASIAFPALLLLKDEDYYDAVHSLQDLQSDIAPGTRKIGWEIVDSAGQRFLIRAVVDPRRVGAGWKTWLQDLGFGRKRFDFDLELQPLPSATFEETLQRVMEKESAQEAYHLMEGGGPDSADDRRRLERCRSIADIIALHDD